MSVIGTSSAAEAVSTPLNNVWMTWKGEAPTCRLQAHKGTHDRGASLRISVKGNFHARF
jgi:hypothetical protein